MATFPKPAPRTVSTSIASTFNRDFLDWAHNGTDINGFIELFKNHVGLVSAQEAGDADEEAAAKSHCTVESCLAIEAYQIAIVAVEAYTDLVQNC